mgnify:CR=1 FL=1
MNNKKTVLKMMEKAVKIGKSHGYGDWPYCAGIFHQPKRPMKSEKKETL